MKQRLELKKTWEKSDKLYYKWKGYDNSRVIARLIRINYYAEPDSPSRKTEHDSEQDLAKQNRILKKILEVLKIKYLILVN